MAEEAMRAAILDAALPHVPFDGWSEATLLAAAADSGVASGVPGAMAIRASGSRAASARRQAWPPPASGWETMRRMAPIIGDRVTAIPSAVP